MKIGETIGIEPHQVQDRGVQVLDVEAVFHSLRSEFIGGSDGGATLDTSTCHPHRETVGVVVAPGAFGVLCCRLTTKFTAPDHQRLIQHPAILEILEEPGDGLVGGAGVLVVVEL